MSAVHTQTFSSQQHQYLEAIKQSFVKLDPRRLARNPVMFVVEAVSALSTGLWIQSLTGQGEATPAFIGAVAVWLWFTVLFANFSESLAEGRGRAQAEALRRARRETQAKKLSQPNSRLLPPAICFRETWCWWRPAIPSRSTGKSSKVSLR
jgi:high-affinity K+ transport system ATPase subunit B